MRGNLPGAETILKKKNLSTAVGDEGGFAPDLKDSREVLEQILEAVTKAGYEPGEDIGIAIDAAASELYDENKDAYYFPGESKMTGKEVLRDASEMIDYYEMLLDEFPIVSIEDGLQEDDWEGWKDMTSRIGNRVQLVGDDLFVTNIKRLSCGIRLGTANAILIKVNQIGTLTESLEAVELGCPGSYRSVISHRSGRQRIPLLQIWQWPQVPDRSKQELPAGPTEMPSTTSCFGSMNSLAGYRCMRIRLHDSGSKCCLGAQ